MPEARVQLNATYIAVTAALPTWYLAVKDYIDTSRHRAAYLLLDISFLTTSGGSVTIYVEACPVTSNLNEAWTTIGTLSSISTTGPRVVKITRTSATPISGMLRLKVVRNTADVELVLRVQTLLKEACSAEVLDWLPPTLVSFSGSGTLEMTADQWLPATRYTNVFVLCEFVLRSGTASNLTVGLQTAPSWSAAMAGNWIDLDTGTVSTGALQLIGLETGTPPPLEVLRLRYEAAAAVSGTLQVYLLGKG